MRSDFGDADEEDDCWPWEEPLYTVENGIARVVISGPLIKGYDDFSCWWYGCASIDRIQSTLIELADRGDIRSIEFVINSPGGMSVGMPETASLMVALGENKNTVGFTGDCAASNGYRLLCAANVVIVTPSSIVGSIGTYIALYDYSEYLANLGIKLELFRAGDMKGIGVMGKSLTPKERAFLDDSVKRCNDMFTGFVRDRRGDVADSTMQGQWFDGMQAKDLNLVDALVTTELEVTAKLRTMPAFGS